MKQLTTLVSIFNTSHCVAGFVAGGDAKSHGISGGSTSNGHPIRERTPGGSLPAFQSIIRASNMQPGAGPVGRVTLTCNTRRTHNPRHRDLFGAQEAGSFRSRKQTTCLVLHKPLCYFQSKSYCNRSLVQQLPLKQLRFRSLRKKY
jgi:hypothetical protein